MCIWMYSSRESLICLLGAVHQLQLFGCTQLSGRHTSGCNSRTEFSLTSACNDLHTFATDAGVDAILLGSETLRGKFPTEAVSTVSLICRQAERVFDYRQVRATPQSSY